MGYEEWSMLVSLSARFSPMPVRVNWCHDVGPATKLLPTLTLERDPSTLLITADDDVWYHAEAVAELVTAIQTWPHAAYNFAGQLIEPKDGDSYRVLSADTKAFSWEPQAVDILEAFLGAVYRRDFFSDAMEEAGNGGSELRAMCHFRRCGT